MTKCCRILKQISEYISLACDAWNVQWMSCKHTGLGFTFNLIFSTLGLRMAERQCVCSKNALLAFASPTALNCCHALRWYCFPLECHECYVLNETSNSNTKTNQRTNVCVCALVQLWTPPKRREVIITKIIATTIGKSVTESGKSSNNKRKIEPVRKA